MENVSTFVSTKGQVVIPKIVRDAAGLRPGDRLSVAYKEGKIVLSPVPFVQEKSLYGMYKGLDLLGDLKRERQAELRDEVDRGFGKKQRDS